MINIKIFAVLFAAAFIIISAFPVFAVPSQPESSQSSGYEESYSQESSYDEYSYTEETSYEQSSDDSSYSQWDESSASDEYENYTEQESSEEESQDSQDEESSETEDSADEKSAESSGEKDDLKITDPFEKLKSMDYILPADDPNYLAKQKTEESAKGLGTLRHSSGLLDSPPMPGKEVSSALNYKDEDDSSLLMGIIIWSVIGIVITVLLIFIINLKGGKSSFGRKRYYKNTYRPSRRSHTKYKISGR